MNVSLLRSGGNTAVRTVQSIKRVRDLQTSARAMLDITSSHMQAGPRYIPPPKDAGGRGVPESSTLAADAQYFIFRFPLDTLQTTKRLKSSGFTEEQSEEVVRVLEEVLQESYAGIARNVVRREELEVVRKDISALQAQDVGSIRTEYQRISAESEKMIDHVNDEIAKLKSNVRLDFSLEKGRIREETTVMEMKVKDSNNKIDTEVAALRTAIESMKLDLIRYSGSMFLSAGALFLAYLRFAA
eukprot:Clim_evm12s231 gene=Clim_evmTU12s231